MSNGGQFKNTTNTIAANIQLLGAFNYGVVIFIPFLVFVGSAFRPL